MTCGNGTKTTTRQVLKQPQHGGEPCPPLEVTERCNTQQCPGIYHLLNTKKRIVFSFFKKWTAKLVIGRSGPTAAQPAEVEPRPEAGELFERQRMEELPAQLWRNRSLATLTNAQVISYSYEIILCLFS